ncbi:MAG TPA: DNA recombination protein RmuC [Thermodesulfobacteriota bacterium]|nr:DNA recombination protein RmuC [Thermodesulfobacteriota bacterium]
MPVITLLFVFIAGFVLGIAAALILRMVQTKNAKELAEELFQESEAKRKVDLEAVLDHVKASFGSLSLDALSKSTEEFLKLAKSKLDAERESSEKDLGTKKALIDQQLQRMSTELEGVTKFMQELEKDRVEKFGVLASQLKTAGEQTAALVQVTATIREALASTKVRGQWGERMAEDVLKLAGFVEKINYLKQKSIEGASSRPDFTFLLPNNLKLNMDVKFPLDNYLKYLEAQSEVDKAMYRTAFLRDVKARTKEVTTREYINPDDNTVDCVLLFIPNEQVYAFIHEQDSSILENGIKNKVVFCSPITLFAVLAVVRQAVEHFSLEKTSRDILSLLGRFKKQWDEFCNKLETLGKRIEDTQREYGILMTTRRHQLEKPLDKIEFLRTQWGLPVPPEEDGESDDYRRSAPLRQDK